MKNEEVFKEMRVTYLTGYIRGSSIYGTYEEGVSDVDHLLVVPNSYGEFLNQFPGGIGQYSFIESGRSYTTMDIDGDYRYAGDLPDRSVDCEFVTEDTFIKMIDENKIVALEAIFLKGGPAFGLVDKLKEYRNRFVLDKWKLRENVSAICSNSWVKAKKKLTVEKDYNLRVGQKSLFHALRIYLFGCQIAEFGEITDYTCASGLWKEISEVENPSWEYYKEKYQKLFNEYRSKLVKLCPRPV